MYNNIHVCGRTKRKETITSNDRPDDGVASRGENRETVLFLKLLKNNNNMKIMLDDHWRKKIRNRWSVVGKMGPKWISSTTAVSTVITDSVVWVRASVRV